MPEILTELLRFTALVASFFNLTSNSNSRLSFDANLSITAVTPSTVTLAVLPFLVLTELPWLNLPHLLISLSCSLGSSVTKRFVAALLPKLVTVILYFTVESGPYFAVTLVPS